MFQILTWQICPSTVVLVVGVGVAFEPSRLACVPKVSYENNDVLVNSMGCVRIYCTSKKYFDGCIRLGICDKDTR